MLPLFRAIVKEELPLILDFLYFDRNICMHLVLKDCSSRVV